MDAPSHPDLLDLDRLQSLLDAQAALVGVRISLAAPGPLPEGMTAFQVPIALEGQVLATIHVGPFALKTDSDATGLTPAQVKALTLSLQGLADLVLDLECGLEAAHSEQENRFRILADLTFDGLVIHQDGRVVEANDAYLHLMGFDTFDAFMAGVGNMLDRVVPEERDAVARRIGEGCEGKFRNHLIGGNGRIFPAEIVVRNLECGGRPARGCFIRDLSIWEETEQALQMSWERYQALVEGLSEGILAVDLDATITFGNPSICRMLGYSLQELCGRSLFSLLAPEDQGGFRERMAHRRQGISERYEMPLLRKDGTPLLFALSGSPLRGPEGEVVGAFAMLTDISEQRRALEALRESEAKFRGVFENMQDVFYRSDAEGRLILVSPSGLRLLGYADEREILGRDIAETWYLHPEDRKVVLAALENTGVVTGCEVTLRKKDGTPVLVSTNSHFYLDPEGRRLGVEGVFFDITEQKRAQEALRRSEEAYRHVVDRIHDIIYAYLPDGTVSFASESVRNLGYRPEEVVGQSIFSFVHPDDLTQAQAVNQLTRQGQAGLLELRVRHKDGRWIWCEEQSEPYMEEGALVQINGVLRNITRRREAEQALRESEQRYRALLEAQGEGVAYVDGDEIFHFVNPKAELIFGVPPGTLNARCLLEFTEPEQAHLVRVQTAERNLGVQSTYDLVIRRPDGENRTLLVTATPHTMPDGARGVLGIFRDITDWRRAEESLRRLSSAIAQASDSITITDTDGTILYANPATEELTGLPLPLLLGRSLSTLAAEQGLLEAGGPLWRSVLDGGVWRGRLGIARPDGRERATTTSFSPVRNDAGEVQYVVSDCRDITREAELEAQLRHSQRMEAIGVLAGGIAHDFNNILTPILGYAEMALMRLQGEPKVREYLEEIFSAGRRAAALVDQILTFSRHTDQDKRAVRLVSIVKESLKLLRAAIPSTINIELDLYEEAGSVMADPSHLHQIVINLCTNAFHAMKETGGTLRVRLTDMCFHEDCHLEGSPLPAGTYVCLQVEDTGHGMDEETRKRAFLPFFTTKKVGEGTGLGLSIVHGIVMALGGAITVSSSLGHGALFTIYLPAHGCEVGEPSRKAPDLDQGGERILVLDDEDMVGGMLRDMLTALGYQVAVLDASPVALKTLELAPDQWDLLLTDMTMPELTGLELVARLREAGIRLPVILMTGYSEGLDESRIAELGIQALVTKPIPLPTLARTIREVLDRAQVPAGR